MSEYYVGLMSGTSADAIDAALVRFEADHRPAVENSCAITYPETIRTAILSIAKSQSVDLDRFGELDISLGRLFADAAQTAIGTFSAARVRAIGSHGQTVRHCPTNRTPFTLQLGHGAVIAERTGIITVVDFRSADMAAGGQGAPLVPAFHHAVFHDSDECRAIVNVGGIANVSYIPANKSQQTLGFDTGPGNTLLDHWTHRHRGTAFDADGAWGARGTVDNQLLHRLMSDVYFTRSPPKSTGPEYFNLDWLDSILATHPKKTTPADVQATLTSFTAFTILEQIRRFLPATHRLFVCGGGIHNRGLMETLANNTQIPIATTSVLGLDPDWVEATAFAWLAKQRLQTRSANVPTVTGARHPAVLGAVYSPPVN